MSAVDIAKNPTPVGLAIALVGGKRAVVWLAWAVLATALLVLQSCRLSGEQARGAACKGTVSNFNATQTGNLATIESLQHRLAVEATKREVEAKAHTEALRTAAAVAMQADAANTLLNQELAKLYAADDGARAWADTGVDAGVLASLPGAK